MIPPPPSFKLGKFFCSEYLSKCWLLFCLTCTNLNFRLNLVKISPKISYFEESSLVLECIPKIRATNIKHNDKSTLFSLFQCLKPKYSSSQLDLVKSSPSTIRVSFIFYIGIMLVNYHICSLVS